MLAISTRGNSRDIVKAVEAAVTRDMTIVALTGYDGGAVTIREAEQEKRFEKNEVAMVRLHVDF